MSRICWHSQIKTIKKIYCLSHYLNISFNAGKQGERDLTHLCTCFQGATMVAKLKQRKKYESFKVRVYIENKSTVLDVDSSVGHKVQSTDKKIRKVRKCTKGISFQTSKSIQRQNQKQKLWSFKSDLHKSVLCLFPFSFTV